MSFPARLVSGNSRSLEKSELGHHPPSHPKEKILRRVLVFVRGYLRVRFDLAGFINFRDISGFPKLGAYSPYDGSPQRVQSGTIGFY